MPLTKATQNPPARVGETNNCYVSFNGQLRSGESLTGTPTAAEQTTSDLTIGSVAVSTGSLIINGKTVTTGRAVTMSVSGWVAANAPYTILVQCSTDSTPAQTLIGELEIPVED